MVSKSYGSTSGCLTKNIAIALTIVFITFGILQLFPISKNRSIDQRSMKEEFCRNGHTEKHISEVFQELERSAGI